MPDASLHIPAPTEAQAAAHKATLRELVASVLRALDIETPQARLTEAIQLVDLSGSCKDVETVLEGLRRVFQHVGVRGRVCTDTATRRVAEVCSGIVMVGVDFDKASTSMGAWHMIYAGKGQHAHVATFVDDQVRRQRVRHRHQLLTLSELRDTSHWLVLEPAFALESMRSKGEKPMSPWHRMRAMVRLERKSLAVALSYAVAIGALSLVTPVAVQSLVNTIAMGSLLQPLIVLTILLFVGLVFRATLQATEMVVVELLQRRVFVRMTEDFAWRLIKARPSALIQRNGPELLNRFFDVVTIQKSLSGLLLNGLALLLQTMMGMILLAFYHPLLLVLDLLIVLFFAVILTVLGRGATQASVEESKAKYATAAWLQDMAHYPVLLRNGQYAAHALRHALQLCRQYLQKREKHFRLLLRQMVGGLALQVIAMVSLLGIGGFLVMQGQLTLGQLIAAELVVGAMGAGFAKLGKHLEKAYDLFAAADKIGMVVDIDNEPVGTLRLDAQTPFSLQTQDMSFAHPGMEKLWQPFSMTLHQGDSLALQGPAAAGKSSFIDLLWGIEAPSQGRVMINQLDLRLADLAQWRSQAWLIRDTHTLEASIFDNLCLDRSYAMETLDAAIQLWGLAEVAHRLPQGLKTLLKPGGHPLSRSHVARLVMARAWLYQPRVWLIDGLLDELHLDDADLHAALEQLFDPMGQRIVVVTTRDARVQACCARRLQLARGRLQEVT